MPYNMEKRKNTTKDSEGFMSYTQTLLLKIFIIMECGASFSSFSFFACLVVGVALLLWYTYATKIHTYTRFLMETAIDSRFLLPHQKAASPSPSTHSSLCNVDDSFIALFFFATLTLLRVFEVGTKSLTPSFPQDIFWRMRESLQKI